MIGQISYKKENQAYLIKIIPDETGVDSKSGKSVIVASTGGFLELENGVRISINMIRSKKQRKPRVLEAE